MTTLNQAWPPGADAEKSKIREFLSVVSIGANAFNILDRNLDTPPSNPTEGDAHIVAAVGTGAWSGHDNDIAYWGGSSWLFVPATGLVNILSEGVLAFWSGTSWIDIATAPDVAGDLVDVYAAISNTATSLQAAIDGKAASAHGHAISDLPITISTSEPSGGSDGDLWFVQEA